jgi:hypothetical protein
MTVTPETITPAGRPARVSSSSPVSGRPANPITDCQRQTLAALKANGNSYTAARALGVGDKVFSNRIHELRVKGLIGKDEYKRRLVSPIVAKVQASRDAREHVLEEIHFSTQGHVLSSLRCSCGVKIRTCDPNRDRGHAKLYTLFEHHKNGPDVRGIGPRDESGRLIAEAPME